MNFLKTICKDSILWRFAALACVLIPGGGLGECLIREKPVATGQELAEFLQATDATCSGNAKLAYVNGCDYEGALCYVEYAGGDQTPEVHTIAGADSARVPVISPDGEWVAYAVGPGAEGHMRGGASAAYICRLAPDAIPARIADSAHEPRFAFEQPHPDTLIIVYGTAGGVNYAEEGQMGATMRVAVDVSGETPVAGAARPLFEQASMMGGLSRDGRYLASAGGDAVMVDLQSENPSVTALASGEHPCAISPSIYPGAAHAGIMMVLDFGRGETSKWKTLWMLDYDGAVRGSCVIPSHDDRYPYARGWPTDYQGLDTAVDTASVCWMHPEWSNHPYFAASGVMLTRSYGYDGGVFTKTSRIERLYAVDVKTSRTLCLLSPADDALDEPRPLSQFNYPWLWVEIDQAFEEEHNWLAATGGTYRGRPRGVAPGIRISSRGILAPFPIARAELFLPDGTLIVRIDDCRGRLAPIDIGALRGVAAPCIARLSGTDGRRLISMVPIIR